MPQGECLPQGVLRKARHAGGVHALNVLPARPGAESSEQRAVPADCGVCAASRGSTGSWRADACKHATSNCCSAPVCLPLPCLQHYADKRPRIKGRFVSPEEFAAWEQQEQEGLQAGAAVAAC